MTMISIKNAEDYYISINEQATKIVATSIFGETTDVLTIEKDLESHEWSVTGSALHPKDPVESLVYSQAMVAAHNALFDLLNF